MTDAEIETQVYQIMTKVAPDATRAVTPDARLIDDLGFHSLAMLELAVELEETFDLPPLDEEAARQIGDVGDVSRLVVGLVRAREAG